MKKTVTILTMLMVCVLAFAGCLQLEKAESISFVTLPANTYVMGDTTAKLSFSLGITYNSGSQTDLVKFEGTWGDLANAEKPEQMTVTGFDLSTAGEKTLTVSYGTLQLTFPYTVIAYDLDGAGTAEDPILIYNREQMARMTEDYNAENATPKYYKMADGIGEIDASDWTSLYLCGSFDGNGVVFNGLDNPLFNRIIGNKDLVAISSTYLDNTVYNFENDIECVVENFTVIADMQTGKCAAAVAYTSSPKLLLKDITVNGYLEGATGAASFVAYGPSNHFDVDPGNAPYQLTFDNCYSDASVVNVGDSVKSSAGFVWHLYSSKNNTTITLKNTKFEGSLSFIGNSVNSAKYFSVMGNGVITETYTNGDSSEGLYEGTLSVSSIYGKQDKVFFYTQSGITLPEKYSEFTVDKVDRAQYAVAHLIISPNPGNLTGVYLSEELLLNNDGKWTTSAIKYFDIAINSEITESTGISADGTTYNVVRNGFVGHNGASVRVIQYDARWNIVGVSFVKIADKADV